MATAKFIENDGREWYELHGQDDGTGVEFSGDLYGVAADGAILDSDGCPLTEGDWRTIAVRNTLQK